MLLLLLACVASLVHDWMLVIWLSVLLVLVSKKHQMLQKEVVEVEEMASDHETVQVSRLQMMKNLKNLNGFLSKRLQMHHP
jgi:hypothetical protein